MIRKDPPIAWLQLRAQKAQTFAAIASISFITVLIFMQIGFRAAFLDALFELPRKLQGDLFLFSTATTSVQLPTGFSQRRLYQVSAFEGVESVTPLYFQSSKVSKPVGKTGFSRGILVIGFPPIHNPLQIPEIDDNIQLLKEGGVFLFDRLSFSEFQPIIQEVAERGHKDILIKGVLNMTRVSVKGLFPLGINKVWFGNMLTSDATFMDVFGRGREEINLGVIYLKPGGDPNRMQKELNEYLPADVTVRQKHEILGIELELFEFNTPLGTVFRFALGTAVLVGIIVLYQILFQLTSKYLREYATLKALGFSHGMLLSIVLTQAVTLAIIGYALGLGISYYSYDIMTEMTGMKHTMTNGVAAAVFALVNLISLISALLAIRKLREADPADLFG